MEKMPLRVSSAKNPKLTLPKSGQTWQMTVIEKIYNFCFLYSHLENSCSQDCEPFLDNFGVGLGRKYGRSLERTQGECSMWSLPIGQLQPIFFFHNGRN